MLQTLIYQKFHKAVLEQLKLISNNLLLISNYSRMDNIHSIQTEILPIIFLMANNRFQKEEEFNYYKNLIIPQYDNNIYFYKFLLSSPSKKIMFKPIREAERKFNFLTNIKGRILISY